MTRTRTVAVAVPLLLLASLLAGVAAPPAAAEGARIPTDEWRARQDDYLAWATSDGFSPGSVNDIMATIERSRRDPGATWDPAWVTVDDLAGSFEHIDQMRDTSDFTINRFLQLYARYAGDLTPEVRDAIRQRILAFKYWWDEPQPDGVVDDKYYWTENHFIIFLADEFIAGQLFPDEVFTNNGMTGRERMAHARPLILRWMALRARYGFSEWLSNVYWMEDFMGVFLLAEWSDDPEIATWAQMMLDLMFVELAGHTHEGAFGATHGRSYNKDKMSALDEDTFTMARMVFDDTAYPYQRTDNTSLLAVASRYRPPEVARRIVADDGPAVIRQRQSLPLDPSEPLVADPIPPDGQSYDDPLVWWSMGAQFAWQVVPLSVELIDTYDLWDTDNFGQAASLRPIVEGAEIGQLQELALALACPLNPGLLSEVDTYTWRSPEVMLSTAQDWRKGCRSEQGHIWQATLDANAQVFTTHPRQPLPATTDWYQDTGWWTGDGATPRSVQHDNVNISIYAPGYESVDEGPLAELGYEPLTHAYFPVEYFDEVVETDGWVIGRKGDGYVALWSWRPTEWRLHDPATEPTGGRTERFDLVAPGGADNVWIAEVGRAADWGGADPFAAFVDAVTGAEIAVTDLGPAVGDGFDVRYGSPTGGTVTVGWDAPLRVDGVEIPLTGGARWEAPWATAAWGSLIYRAEAGGEVLVLDFSEFAPYLGPGSTPTTTAPASSTTTTTAPVAVTATIPPRAERVTPRFTG